MMSGFSNPICKLFALCLRQSKYYNYHCYWMGTVISTESIRHLKLLQNLENDKHN